MVSYRCGEQVGVRKLAASKKLNCVDVNSLGMLCKHANQKIGNTQKPNQHATSLCKGKQLELKSRYLKASNARYVQKYVHP